MFYNFWLHPDLIDFSRIDGTPLFPELAKKNENGKLHVAWLRPPMGERHSPYQATQTGWRLKREALGQPSNPHNILGWERVGLNLPGTTGYQPGRPWISKRRTDGHIAVDIYNYIDDGRATAPYSDDCWEASSRQAKQCSCYGCQDAATKKETSKQDPGSLGWGGGCPRWMIDQVGDIIPCRKGPSQGALVTKESRFGPNNPNLGLIGFPNRDFPGFLPQNRETSSLGGFSPNWVKVLQIGFSIYL
jgi:hypothetical protein